MVTKSAPDLSSILTPEIFHAVLKNRIPWPKDKELDFTIIGPYWWHATKEVRNDLLRICVPVLKALSELDLLSFSPEELNLMQYLPDPSSKEFPEQALGCVLLLGQGPRNLSGTDCRWRYSYFDYLSQPLVRKLWALLDGKSPCSKMRWMEELGVPFDYWSIVRVWFIAPLAHSEDVKDHESYLKFTAQGRKETLEYTGVPDPYEKDRERLLKDELAYPRWLPDGPPHGPGAKVEHFAYWMFIMVDVHKAVIDKYGRYPERNAAKGRETRDAELGYLQMTKDFFGEMDPRDVRQLREDVLAERWTPLKGISES